MELAATVGLAVILFVSTNLDDLFVLLGFFLDSRVRLRDVIIGQYLGIGALVVASLAASAISLVIAPGHVRWLGLLPIAIGIRQLIALRRNAGDVEDGATASRVLAIAGVTIANGGDNIGAYTPVFATRESAQIIVILVVFAILIVALLAIAHGLVRHPAWSARIRRYGPRLSPWVLILIGVWILFEPGFYQ